MKFIVEFYKELDTFNTILFWGVIIVIVLLLVFSIIIVNKNRKLKAIIESNGINIDDDKELPIKREIESTKIEQNNITNEINNINEVTIKPPLEEETTLVRENIIKEETAPIKQSEDVFVAEEYVMTNKEVTPTFPINEKPIINKDIEIRPVSTNNQTKPTGPYQRNVLREMSLSQTSPIGITKQDNNSNNELNKARELQKSFDETRNNYYDKNTNNAYERTTNNISIQNDHAKYLREVSDKLIERSNNDQVERTQYELRQEEDAIISYQELMQKKDNIKMVDEEDAVISIEELMNRKQEKIYNITPEEEDNKFIDELKNFRSDL